jgi:hypothetical protein
MMGRKTKDRWIFDEFYKSCCRHEQEIFTSCFLNVFAPIDYPRIYKIDEFDNSKNIPFLNIPFRHWLV